MAALTLSAAAAPAGPDVTGVVSLDPQVIRPITTSSEEYTAGCLPVGNHQIIPIRVAIANVGNIDWTTQIVPAKPCAICPCSTSPISGVYRWSNKACQWQIKNFVDFVVTDAADNLVGTGAASPDVAKAQCVDNFTPSVGPPRCIPGANEGTWAGFTGTLQGQTSCRHINMAQLATNGSYRYSVTVNQAGLVPDDFKANNVVNGAFTVTNGNVSASAPAWQPPETLGVTSNLSDRSVATVSLAPHHIHVVYSDNGTVKVAQKFFGHWETPLSLPGVLTDDIPAAVSWGPNRIDIFVRGRDQVLWHNSTNDGFTWFGWDHPTNAAAIAGAPSVASWDSGRLDVVYLNTVGSLSHVWWSNGWGHEAWALPGPAIPNPYQPAIVSRGPNKLSILVKDGGGYVYIKSWDGAWTAFNFVAIGASGNTKSVALAALNAGEVLAAWKSTQGYLKVAKVVASTSAATLYSFGNILSGTAPTITTWDQGSTSQWDVIYGADAAGGGGGMSLYDLRSTNRGTSWAQQTAAPIGYVGTPSATTWGVNRIDVAYAATATAVGLVSFY
jgi:hypothetical protein